MKRKRKYAMAQYCVVEFKNLIEQENLGGN